jgi:hypothetical protein
MTGCSYSDAAQNEINVYMSMGSNFYTRGWTVIFDHPPTPFCAVVSRTYQTLGVWLGRPQGSKKRAYLFG